MVSPNEVFADLSAVVGRNVITRILPRSEWTSAIEAMGFPSGQTWAFEEIYDGVNTHWIDFGAAGAERIEGTTSARAVFAKAAVELQRIGWTPAAS